MCVWLVREYAHEEDCLGRMSQTCLGLCTAAGPDSGVIDQGARDAAKELRTCSEFVMSFWPSVSVSGKSRKAFPLREEVTHAKGREILGDRMCANHEGLRQCCEPSSVWQMPRGYGHCGLVSHSRAHTWSLSPDRGSRKPSGMNIEDYISHFMADLQIILVVEKETRVFNALEADVLSRHCSQIVSSSTSNFLPRCARALDTFCLQAYRLEFKIDLCRRANMLVRGPPTAMTVALYR